MKSELELHAEELRAQIAAAEEAEKEPEKAEEEEKLEEKPSETKEEEKPEEPERVEKEESPDQAAFAKMRRDKAAAERKAAELEAKLAKREEPKEEIEEVRQELPAEINEILLDHRTQRAEREFTVLEAQFKQSNPDYDAVAAEYAQALAQSIKIQNPRLSALEINERTKNTILAKAGEYVRSGHDPIEELYNEAKELGFTGKSREKPVEIEEKPQPDMKKVAENRKRSAGTAGSSGESKTDMSRAYIAQNGMPTNEEWQRLTPQQKRAILQSA